MFPLLADLTAADVSPILSQLTSLGFAVWFAVRTVTKTLPDMAREHREERKEMTTRFEQTIKELVNELKASRESHEKWKRWTFKIPETGAES